MAFLILRTGQAKGASWPITHIPLVIGRERSCSVSLRDSLVSRRHCEILLQDQIIELKDLGSSNATLVNGEPVRTGTLDFGDEVTVGRTVFEVARAVPQAGEPGPEAHLCTTIVLSEGQAIYLADDSAQQLDENEPHAMADLIQLYRYGRAFSRVETVEELTSTLAQALVERYDPLELWIALLAGTGDSVDLRLKECSPATSAKSLPEAAMRQALDELHGFLVPEYIRHSGSKALQLTLVAPVHFANAPIAAVALRSQSRHRVYDESDLHFLLSLANTVAPFFGALEQRKSLQHEVARLQHAEQKSLVLVGESVSMREVRRKTREVADTRQPVLIVGETGTGKEVVANLIHGLSSHAAGPFIAVNCAAIPDHLFESELFGHERGAFTGAVNRKTGLMEQSNGGTLFLDEIGELTPQHQAAILRSLETKAFRRVGGKEEIRSDFRIIAATNRNIHEAMETGAFRRDLYHRLRGVEITIPPLRERREDITLLAAHFLDQARAQRTSLVAGCSSEALKLLTGQAWPGNVRELKYLIETAAAFCKGAAITAEDIKAVLSQPPLAAPPTMAEAEQRLILDAVEYCKGNVVDAAKHLGVSKDTVYRRLTQYKTSN